MGFPALRKELKELSQYDFPCLTGTRLGQGSAWVSRAHGPTHHTRSGVHIPYIKVVGGGEPLSIKSTCQNNQQLYRCSPQLIDHLLYIPVYIPAWKTTLQGLNSSPICSSCT